MRVWKCESCPNTVEPDDAGAFGVPAGWMKLSRSNTFNVFCSWACLIAFAGIWGEIAEVPESGGSA